jgi:membrane protein YqaA with SNARE-associated domain
VLALTAYLGLFLSAFGAATLLPLQSEAVLVGLLLAKAHPVWALVAVATFGNVLGSLLNWLLGRYVEHFRERRWFPVKPAQMQRAQVFYHRYGRWSLLLAWMPVIGDPLTLVAGVMRESFWVFLALVTLAKAGRYLALAALTLGWGGLA